MTAKRMATDRDTVVALIIDKVRDVDPPALAEFAGDLSEETPLFGDDGLLDSLALVALIVDVEEGVNDALNAHVTIADDRAVSQRASPFRTVGTLADYVLELVNKNDSG